MQRFTKELSLKNAADGRRVEDPSAPARTTTDAKAMLTAYRPSGCANTGALPASSQLTLPLLFVFFTNSWPLSA